MHIDQIITLLILAGAILLFITEWLRVDLVALCVVVALLVTGVLSTGEAIAGFSNSAVLTIAALFIATTGAQAVDQCRAPFAPEVPDTFETEEQLYAVYAEVKDFVQVKSPAYLECLDTLRNKIDPSAEDAATQKAALDEKHNANVNEQEDVGARFNTAYKAWKEANPG